MEKYKDIKFTTLANLPYNKPTKETKTKVESDEEEEELCFICTEPISIYAVASCDHRTCHRCALRLRALYETRNCAYCKAEQKVMIFTRDSEKPFDQYSEGETPFTDKKLAIKFETQEMYKEAKDMLQFNCPQKECREQFKNWGELKQHVRKTHSLNLCDLCTRHKKVFPYEHTLYTNAQLTKHHREGDKDFNTEDETGFSGHPECAFCKTRFYGHDELFIHCRDMHEQCFICTRNGNRHEYYADYSSLEEHFKSDHSLCLYPQCLEKKFIVFDTPIDLKAHEVEVHGESVAGLQRSMQTDARRLELNFQYESYRDQQQQNRANNNNRRNNETTQTKKKQDTPKSNNNQSRPSSSTPTTSAQDFPAIASSSGTTAAPVAPRIIPGASTKKGKGKALQKPAGFGNLTSTAPPTPSTSTSTTPTSNDAVAVSHAAFLNKVGDMLKTKEKVAEFRALTGAYRKSTISGQAYVDGILRLTNNSMENSGKILKGVEGLLDIEDKKLELVKVWRNKQTAIGQFPALETRDKPVQPKPSRVLVIKAPKPVNRVVGAKGAKANVWDKVASAATVANSPKSRPTSAATSPQTSRPSSPSNTFRTPSKTPWSNSSSSGTTKADHALKPKAFPSLPTASPKHQMILNMRRTASGSSINAWGGSNNEDNNNEPELESASSSNGKKKGRKNKVLFRVGL